MENEIPMTLLKDAVESIFKMIKSNNLFLNEFKDFEEANTFLRDCSDEFIFYSYFDDDRQKLFNCEIKIYKNSDGIEKIKLVSDENKIFRVYVDGAVVQGNNLCLIDTQDLVEYFKNKISISKSNSLNENLDWKSDL